MRRSTKGNYTVTEEYHDGFWCITQYRDGRMLECVHTRSASQADSIYWQFRDEVNSWIVKRRWS